MNLAVAKRAGLFASAAGILLLLTAAWCYSQLRASLPQLDGMHAVSGLGAPVTITRDAFGVPTVHGANRTDVARALGFIHAQDRFFQMDLLRRRAAGERAELLGKSALPLDRDARPHQFRTLSKQVLANLLPTERELLESYTAGVNAGLAALGTKPFEYLVLRADPQPWLPEDCLLIAYAMTLNVQEANNNFEHSLSTLRDQFGTGAIAFFAPTLTPDDAAIDGSSAPSPPIPGPEMLDLRHRAKVGAVAHRPSAVSGPMSGSVRRREPPVPDSAADLFPGSNSMALTGAHTANGAALLANDTHLALEVPNIWYRAVVQWTDTAPRQLVGVTLPGLPFVILGSNGHVAWGLTNANADTADLVTIEVDPAAPGRYKVPGHDDPLEFVRDRDTIRVKGGKDEVVESTWTYWGPIVGADSKGRPLANHWVADDPTATNLEWMRLESATSVANAVAIARRSGIPAQNFLVVDDTGAIAWTIAGRLPKRIGFDGNVPVSWASGDSRWDGLLPPEEMPSFAAAGGAPAGLLWTLRHWKVDPAVPDFANAVASGRLWTANNRIVGGPALGLIGNAGYDSPPRAAQVRDDLARIERAKPRDLLAIQLDDRAAFLDRWRQLLLDLLTPEALARHEARARFRRLLDPWDGRASVDSVSYRLVRTFRTTTGELVFEPIFASCIDAFPAFNWRRFNLEPALWAMIAEKPGHLLDPTYADWNELLLAAVDSVIADLDTAQIPLERATWGALNTAQIRHPLGQRLPFGLRDWLDLPAEPLPGDSKTPRVQSPDFGASMRLVVSPGHENEALFEMPGGQSGHPLSPFYRAGHTSWVRGEPAPLLPGVTRHILTLTPIAGNLVSQATTPTGLAGKNDMPPPR